VVTPIQALVRDTRNFTLLTKEQEIELAKQKATGNKEAEDTLVEHNIPLVINLARAANLRAAGIYITEDLVSDGMLGLIRAAKKYDGRARFSTYATYWIKQFIQRSMVDNDPTVAGRVPTYMHQVRQRAKQHVNNIEHCDGQIHSGDTLLNFEGGKYSKRLQAASRTVRSLSSIKPATEGADVHFDEFSGAQVDRGYSQADAADFLSQAFKTLRSREIAILQRYFEFVRLDGDKKATLKNVGDEFGLTRERVRQIVERSLDKLRTYALESGCLSPGDHLTMSSSLSRKAARSSSAYKSAQAAS
jgi:RNA polymerase sigma factor (sigma-70 family)